MADGLLSNESAIEFFKHEVEDAMARQHLKTSDWTSYYVVNLLATFAVDCRPSASLDDEPLRCAADGTDRLSQRGAVALGGTRVA